MTESPASFSLLDAVRIVARGGDLDSKLHALAEQARLAAGAPSATMLFHDADNGVLITPDGAMIVALSSGGSELSRAVVDRVVVAADPVPEGVGVLLKGADRCLLIPLVVEDETGTEVEGVLVVGQSGPMADAAEGTGLSDSLLALADLGAVAIRQARLKNTVWEHTDYADRLVHTDRLTGLANRLTFERMLELEIARATRQGTPLAVAVFDVDGLHDISVTKGASVADQVLRQVASALADRVRLLDTVARFGGDEFGVIAPGDPGGSVALRLRDAISELPPFDDVSITVSAAVVHHPDDGATGTELLAASEVALAMAKRSGPGGVYGARGAAA